MKLQEARTLLEKQGSDVYTIQALRVLMDHPPETTFHKTIRRLVREKVLIKAVRGVYVHAHAPNRDDGTLQRIARAMRQGEYLYLSLESVLSQAGYISQILLDRITIVTTGRSGTYQTPFGVIEFVRTRRPMEETLPFLEEGAGGLLEAPPKIAWRDLKRVGRNVDMVTDVEELER